MCNLLSIRLTEIVQTRTSHLADTTESVVNKHIAALFGTCIAFAVMIAISTIPARTEESIWTHNGSTVRWVTSGEDRWLYYLEPRPELLAIGVEPDTPLFRGKRFGDRLVGTAFVFSASCPPAPYPVQGIVISETDVTLEGPAPVVDPASCVVVDYTWDSYNASLRFRYVMTPERPPFVARGK
jgi:hypothetical protein